MHAFLKFSRWVTLAWISSWILFLMDWALQSSIGGESASSASWISSLGFMVSAGSIKTDPARDKWSDWPVLVTSTITLSTAIWQLPSLTSPPRKYSFYHCQLWASTHMTAVLFKLMEDGGWQSVLWIDVGVQHPIKKYIYISKYLTFSSGISHIQLNNYNKWKTLPGLPHTSS